MPIYIEGSKHYYEAKKSKKGTKNRDKVYKKKKRKPQFFPELSLAVIFKDTKNDKYHSPKRYKAVLRLIAVINIVILTIVAFFLGVHSILGFIFFTGIFSTAVGMMISYNYCEYQEYKFRLREWKVNKEFDKLMDNGE